MNKVVGKLIAKFFFCDMLGLDLDYYLIFNVDHIMDGLRTIEILS